ncbi:B-cell receptor-associated protein 31, partial [Trichinella murrelli]
LMIMIQNGDDRKYFMMILKLSYLTLGSFLMMSLQWTLVALLLWQRLFRSRFLRFIQTYSSLYIYCFALMLLLLFLDALREVRKYSDADLVKQSVGNVQGEFNTHMRLFRAQRNLYISGAALFLWFAIQRVASMISREAMLIASAEAAVRQARNASEAVMKAEQIGDSQHDKDDVVATLKEEVKKLNKELDRVKASETAIREQAEGVNKEYDRLMKEFETLQNTLEESGKKANFLKNIIFRKSVKKAFIFSMRTTTCKSLMLLRNEMLYV